MKLLLGSVCFTLVATVVSSLERQDFSASLFQLANTLSGADQFTNYLQSQLFSQPAARGQEYVQAIASGINSIVNLRATAVRDLKAAIVDAYNVGSSSLSSPVPRCCPAAPLNLRPDPRFPSMTNDQLSCSYGLPPQIVNGKQVDDGFSDRLLATMKQNQANIPSLKWQYFGNEYGVMYTFPAKDTCASINTYDPRLRPWYSFTATYPKDVVIMLDKSRSTSATYLGSGLTKLSVAMRAAQSAVDSLNPNDNVALVAFAENVEPTSIADIPCYGQQLARATPTNKLKLRDYVVSIRGSSQAANYSKAFSFVFDLFTANKALKANDSTSANRTKVILLLANGDPVDSLDTIIDVIANGTSQLGHTVNIIAFGLDTVPESNSRLTTISQQSGGGKFTPLSDPEPDTIRTRIGVYYSFFTKDDADTAVVFSVPYNDSAGLGMVTSACLPVFVLGTFKGVTCIDIPIDTIFRDITDFHLGRSSYAFLVDARGRVLLHPLLPKPETYQQEPIFLDMESVELSSDAEIVKKSMISGSTGNRSVSSLKVVSPRGSTPQEGVTFSFAPATYYWAPIPVMNVSVGLVIVNNELNISLSWTDHDFPDIFLSDELTTNVTDSHGKCNNFGRIAAQNQSAVKLSPMSFVDSYFYTKQDITGFIPSLKLYLQAKTPSQNNLNVTVGVREDIAATYELERIWKTSAAAGLNSSSTTTQLGKYAVYRYIGTRRGVYRIYPAVRLPKDYDPTRQPWYAKAAAQKTASQFTVLTTGNANRLTTTTLSVNVFAPTTSNSVFGVLGVDVPFNAFYNFIVAQFDSCKAPTAQCFAIDGSGFVVAHRDYLTTPPTAPVHVTTKEPQIAVELIEENIMTSDTCLSYADITNQLFWKVTMITGDFALSSGHIYDIDHFDLFVIAKTVPTSDSSSTTCTCSPPNVVGNVGKIPCLAGQQCQCPCCTSTDYSYCSGYFTISSTTKACYQPVVQLYLPDLSTEERTVVSLLSPCMECFLLATESECTSMGCRWNNDTTLTVTGGQQCQSWSTATTTTVQNNPITTEQQQTTSTGTGNQANQSWSRAITALQNNPITEQQQTTAASTGIGCSKTCLGLAIGLPLGGLLVIVIVVTVIIIIRRRKYGTNTTRSRPSSRPWTPNGTKNVTTPDSLRHVTIVTVTQTPSESDDSLRTSTTDYLTMSTLPTNVDTTDHYQTLGDAY